MNTIPSSTQPSMKPAIRRLVLWATLGFLLLLTLLCVYASIQHAENSDFLQTMGWVDYFPHGADGAQEFFNSGPLIVLWVLFVLLLLAGLVLWRSLVRNPGALGMHAGAILLLVGGMVTSEPAHAIWRDLFRSQRVHTGQIQLYPGQKTDQMFVFDKSQGRSAQPETHPLGFTVQLNDFQVHYYPWRLEAVVPDPDQDDSWVSREIHGELDQWVKIPHTPAEVKVTEYVQRIEEQLPPVIRVYRAVGNEYRHVTKMPGTPQAQVELANQNIEITVQQVIEDQMGRPYGALLSINVNGRQTQAYAFTPNHPMQQRLGGEFRAEFFPPMDPEDMRQPGYMDLVIRHDGREVRHRLQADPHEGEGRVLLEELFPDDPGMHERRLDLKRSIKDYLSDVNVLVDGEPVRQKVIEVNHPLRYGGYHLFQMKWGRDERGPHTVLTVRSDRGWNMVVTGLSLIMVGAFWQLWFVPAWKWWKRRSRHGA